MPNARARGIARITITVEEKLLAQIESEAISQGVDRLELIRRAITTFLQAALIERLHAGDPLPMVAETTKPAKAASLPRKVVKYPTKKRGLRSLPPPAEDDQKAN